MWLNNYLSVEKTRMDYLAGKSFLNWTNMKFGQYLQTQIDITNMNGDILVQNPGY